MSAVIQHALAAPQCDDCQDDPIANMIDGYCPSCGEGRCLPCGGTGKIESEFGDTDRAYRCDFCELRSPKKVRTAEKAWEARQRELTAEKAEIQRKPELVARIDAMLRVEIGKLATCACGYAPDDHAPTSVEYHREHKAVHLEMFPLVSQQTVEYLDFLIRLADRGLFLSPGPVVS